MEQKAEVEPALSTLDRFTGRLLTVEEVAELMRVSPATIRRWAGQGVLESIKIGPESGRKTIRIRGRSLDAYLHPDEQTNFLRSEIDLRIHRP